MKWEYRTVKFESKGMLGGHVNEAKIDASLNDLGGQGWELVSAFDTNSFAQGATRWLVFLFKRPGA